MFKVWMVRHGETFLNSLKRFQGWVDSDLTSLGIEQAEKIGEELSGIDFKIVVSSDLERAVKTRDEIVKKLKKTPLLIKKDKIFREVFFGSFEAVPVKKAWDFICKDTIYKNQDDIIMHGGFDEARTLMKEKDFLHRSETNKDVIDRWHKGLQMDLG